MDRADGPAEHRARRETYRIPADLTREDVLYVNDGGVVLGPGTERIFLRDTNLDVDDARLLAAAILEYCDRMDGAR